MVTSENGTFHASSTYKIKPGYAAEKAFGTAGYWCSIQDPPKPIRLWFQFNKPTCVTKIRFETPYKMTGEKGYEVNEIAQQGLYTAISRQLMFMPAF